MVITFQVQIDPLDGKREFTKEELAEMCGRLNEFMSRLESFKEYIRGNMYVNGEYFQGS